MKSLIYYPHFEPHQADWFKISLLYLDNISPIIPRSGQIFLSEDFRKVIDSTDFIKVHNPKINEANRASRFAVNELSRIVNNPYDVVDIFNSANIVRHWRDSEKDATLFNEKYTYEFENFCIHNGFAEPSNFGMQISSSLAHIYMTILSNEIAFQSGLSSVTDNEIYDDFALYIKAKDVRFNQEFQTAINTIQVAIPKDISLVPLDKIIKLRNDKEFRQMVAAFHQIIEKYQSNLTSNLEIRTLIEDLKQIKNGISSKIIENGLQILDFIIKMINLKPDEKYIEYVRDFLNGARMTIKAGESVRQFKSDNERNKFCKQYLLKLENL
jgi:hypothetical protein